MSEFINTMGEIIKVLLGDDATDSQVCYLTDVYGGLLSGHAEFELNFDVIHTITVLHGRELSVEDAISLIADNWIKNSTKLHNNKDDSFIITTDDLDAMYLRVRAAVDNDGKIKAQDDINLILDDAAWNVYNTGGTYKIVIVRGNPKIGDASLVLSKETIFEYL